MTLPNDTARCDGLLPNLTQHNGKGMILWSLDCPKREECARFLQIMRDLDKPHRMPYISHHHAPGETCPDFIQESQPAPGQ